MDSGPSEYPETRNLWNRPQESASQVAFPQPRGPVRLCPVGSGNHWPYALAESAVVSSPEFLSLDLRYDMLRNPVRKPREKGTEKEKPMFFRFTSGVRLECDAGNAPLWAVARLITLLAWPISAEDWRLLGSSQNQQS